MKRRVWAAAATAMTTTLAIGIAGASPASAGQTWQQATVRADPNGGCPESTAEELAQGWTPWTPSYDMWPNGGQGGWTCTRYITWANDGAPAGSSTGGSVGLASCQQLNSNREYVDFGSGWVVLAYSDTYIAGCGETGGDGVGPRDLILATSEADAAAKCAEHMSLPGSEVTPTGLNPLIWICE